MNQSIPSNGGILACWLQETESKDGIKYFSAFFPRAKWAFFKNENYEEIVNKIDNKEKDAFDYYSSKASVPKYTIFKNSKKIGIALPRENELHKFLYIPRTYKKKMLSNRKYSILRDYYIFDLEDDFMIRENSRLMFFQ